ERKWNNEFTVWSTGAPWDLQYHEFTYYIAPEVYPMLDVMRGGYRQAARNVNLRNDFWSWSLPERRAWFVKETMVNYVPQEILPGDLIAGGRFNILTSMCLTEKEQKKYNKKILGKKGARAGVKWFHDHGYGNAGATCGHLVPGHERALKLGWRGVYAELEKKHHSLTKKERRGGKGAQLRAMMTAATMPRDLAAKYADLCASLADGETDGARKEELSMMAENLRHAPWKPARTFWEALQALWLNHMLIMSDENYPGPGVSLGRIDQYLLPYWKHSKENGMEREFAKELLKCFWIHCNTAYDAT
ncbi:MAG: hypothetical protein GY859_26785, partial [Desulfobacterales bacterium]|nr:hypothetical protein [Desulfobacterales bacterium]